MKKNDQNLEAMLHLPDGRLLLRVSVPIVASLMVQGLYSLVDSMFLARLGERALSAMGLSFVVQSLAAAFFAGIATGINALLSRALGRRDEPGARAVAVSGFLVQGLLVLLFTLFGLFDTRLYFERSTTDAEVIALGVRYLGPCMGLILFSAAQVTLERTLQSTGITKYVLYVQAAGTAVNLILDPILIFGWLGCPALGVTGAACATLLGQLTAALLALYYNVRHNGPLFHRLLREVRPDRRIMGEVCRIGVPSAMVGIASSLGNYCVNRILIDFSPTANAAFGVYTKVQAVAVLPVQGLSMGLVTLLSFFYGRRDLGRFRGTLRAGERFLGGWGLFCVILFTVFPTALMSVFDPTEQMLRVGIPCFRMIGTTYLFSSLMTGCNAFFQTTGKPMYPLLITLSRQVLVRIPVALYLATLGVIHWIWWCWPVSEIVSDAVCLALFLHAYRPFLRTFNTKTIETE